MPGRRGRDVEDLQRVADALKHQAVDREDASEIVGLIELGEPGGESRRGSIEWGTAGTCQVGHRRVQDLDGGLVVSCIRRLQPGFD
jgi:hypothetical protein